MELDEIAKKYQDKDKKIVRLQKAEKIAKILIKLKNNEGIKLLLENLVKMVQSVEEKLIWEKNLTEIERACLFQERDCWEWLLRQFDSQNQTLKKIENFKEKYD